MKPRTAALDHGTAGRLAATEYQRCLELLRSLSPADWDTPTDCPEWNVRQVAAHLLGMVEMAASVPELLRTQRLADRAAARSGRASIDELTKLQVAERADWTPTMIIERFATRAPAAVAGRRRVPGLLRGVRLPGTQHVNGADEPWTIGYLTDVILTRDPWMHRIDISRATGAAPLLSADHDGTIVADVIAEWTDRHGKDYRLDLDGAAGGGWSVGSNGPRLRADAVDFARALSGRPTALDSDHLLSTHVPF
jgi:uncharacterized protein (TIGR03083 family)